jgi:hypothetical protein
MTRTKLSKPVVASSTGKPVMLIAATGAILLAALLWLPAAFAAPPATASMAVRVPACQYTVVGDAEMASAAGMAAGKDTKECDKWRAWKQQQQAGRPKPKDKTKSKPPVPQPLPVLPAPTLAPQSLLERIQHSVVAAAGELLNWIGGRSAYADGCTPGIDGDLCDWLPDERIDLPLVYLPPALVTGPELYGKYDATSQSYLLALETPADALTPSSLTTGTDDTHLVSTTDELDNRLVGDKVTNATQSSAISYVTAVDAATHTLTLSPAITGQISTDSITIEHATTIGEGTTFWLNVDPNANPPTGDPSSNGADYAIAIWSSGGVLFPELYQYQADAWVPQGPLSSSYAFSSDQRALEVAIPASLLGLGVTSPQPSITLVADVNNAIFLPAVYADGSFTLPGEPPPPRTDFSKRVGVVYCTATAQNFYGADNPANSRSYSQLFMAMQHQSMMAGIPFDLLTETDLTDVNKIVNYDALIFPYCADVPLADLDAIHDTLYKAVYHYDIGIITADNFITDDENGDPIPGDAYRFMNQLLGLDYVAGYGPVTTLQHHASDVAHPVMRGYDPNELIMDLPGNWFNYYVSVAGQPVTTLVTQTVTGTPNGSLDGTWNSLLAVTTGARHVHFSSIELLGNSNLVWQALQWVLYGDAVPVGLKMGRNNSVFLSRTDMDQSQETDLTNLTDPEGFNLVDVPLYPLMAGWKSTYNFVGSQYINIGDDEVQSGRMTDWTHSGPLYRNFIALDNEIGTHSYTHPDDTNSATFPGYPNLSMGAVVSDGHYSYSSSQWPDFLQFEFKDSMDTILACLGTTPSDTGCVAGHTWRDQDIRGAAVPGMPEYLDATRTIVSRGNLTYLTGGYSGVGAGYPGAFGYLTPADSSFVYFSPSMYFDFTLMEWGIPNGDLPPESSPPNPSGHTPLPAACTSGSTLCAEVYWPQQYLGLLSHASQPLVVWPWHDYGPTYSSSINNPSCVNSATPGVPDPTQTGCYSTAMYDNVMSTAYASGAEFVSLVDAAQRIATQKAASLTVAEDPANQTVTATVATPGVGKLALELDGQQIRSVDNWYAYSGNRVFLGDAGGTFVIHLGSTEASITHISALPMRARLMSVNGNGSYLTFTFEGAGTVQIAAAGDAAKYQVTSADNPTVTTGSQLIEVTFTTFGTHTATLDYTVDSDSDGLDDVFEGILGTDPNKADTDNDGLSDGAEVGYDLDILHYTPGLDTDPLNPDTDGDGLVDGLDPSPLDPTNSGNVADGDVAPWGAPDGQVNAADVMVMQQIVLGLRSAGPLQLIHGDLYPPPAGDGVINLQDLILLMKKVLP